MKDNIKIWAISIAVVALIAVFFVIYGVATHKESGLLTVCWREDGVAEYIEDLNVEDICEFPSPLVWPDKQIPLSVKIIDAENRVIKEPNPGAKIVHEAMSDFNSQIGALVFDLAKAGDSYPDVILVWGVPIEVGNKDESIEIGGYVKHTKINGRMQAAVRIRETSFDRLAFVTTLHELGHSIGLAHDDFINSIMYPDMTTLELNTTTTRITDHDVKLIRTTYGLR